MHELEEVAALVAVSFKELAPTSIDALALVLGGTKDRLVGIKGFRGGKCIWLVSGSELFCHSCSMLTGIASLQ